MNFSGDTIQITGYQIGVGGLPVPGSPSTPSTGGLPVPGSGVGLPFFTLELDNSTMQQIGFDNVITQQPTTRGTPINDNIYRLPIKYQIEGLLSASTVNGSFSPTNLLSHFTFLSTRFSNVQNAALNVYIFTINTGFATFTSMGLLSCVLKQEVSAFNALRYVMTFQEAILAPSSANQTQNNYNRDPANRGKINV